MPSDAFDCFTVLARQNKTFSSSSSGVSTGKVRVFKNFSHAQKDSAVFNDDKFDQSFTPLKININQSEQQILRLIMKVPPLERCEQILYAIASENIKLQVANNLIRAIGILERLSYIQALEIESEIFSLPKSKTQI